MIDSFFTKEEDKKLFKNLIIILVGMLILLFAALFVNTVRASKFVGLDIAPANTLVFSGEAEISAVPDTATIQFSLEETNDDTKIAQNVVSEKTDIILNALDGVGVEKKDIKTEQYSIYPKYQYNRETGEQKIVGQVVSQSVTIKVRSIESVPDVLVILTDGGASNINGPSFDIDNKDDLERQARRLAIEKAKDEAKALAGDLGVHLIRIVGYNESGGGIPPMPMYEKASLSMAGDSSIPPQLPEGENIIRASVTITYEVR